MNSPTHTHAFANRQTQRGVSLVELMISITIGLLILSSLTTLFVNQSRTRADLDKSNRMIDNGRYALEVLSENLRVAGFYGERDITPAGAINDPCTSNPATPVLAELEAALGLHVAGYNAATATADITGTPPCGLAAQLKAGSDILVLRRVDTSDPVAQTAAIDGIHYIQVSNCRFNTTPFILDSVKDNFNLGQRDCTAASTAPFANVRRLVVQAYFVSPDNIADDGIPTLKRIELSGGAFIVTPLVEGIEYMQVEYGLDADADGAADAYCDSTSTTAPCHLFTTADWNNVVSVKINIIARNTELTTGYVDTKTYFYGKPWEYTPSGSDRNYKRHAYTQVVRLVNPSGRRETP